MAKKLGQGFIYFILFGWLLAVIFPIIYMFMSSFKSDEEIVNDPWSFPDVLRFGNYIESLGSGSANLGIYFMNSVIVTAGTLILVIILSTLAGYALARYPFFGNNAIFKSMFILIAIPVHALLVPVFVMMENFDLVDSIWGLVLIYTTFQLPFSIIIMRSYFESVPKAIEESARMDGCNELRVFWLIAVPVAKGAIATLVIINMVTIWSELLFASVLLTSPDSRTLPVGIMNLAGGMYGTSQSLLFASLCIATLPMLVIYFIFQNQIQKGMTVGAVK
jgi:raffinose/stachyose/melibiose transport system permease protein